MPKLRFAENTADEGEGLSDAGIETYRDDPFPAVARETVQNSRDAHDGSENPVRIEFDRFTISPKDFPDLEGYKTSVSACLDTARSDANEKEIAFFEQAKTLLESKTIPALKIADFNTRGLRGPCSSSPPTPFYALVKSSGSSVKDQLSAGGSFGIGKSAVYSASDLQTAFYSTIYHDENSGEPKFLCQGKTKFRSHLGEDDISYRSTGYWGNTTGYSPVEKPDEVPEWARRNQKGTTVISLGVRDSENWNERLVCSILVNFYGAIGDGKMSLRVGDQEINKSNLMSLLEIPSMRPHARTPEDYDLAKTGLECLTTPSITQNFHIDGVGEFRLDLLIRDGLPKKVIVLRNGMMICTSLDHFSDKFQHFRLHKDFIAVLQPVEPVKGDDSPNASEWMRRLENPTHDELSPERLLKESERKTARAKGGMLASKVRDVIKAEAKKPAGQHTALDELSQFFADDTPREEDSLGQRGIQTVKITKRPPPVKSRPKTKEIEKEAGKEGGSSKENGDGSSGESSGPGEGSGSGGSGDQNHVREMTITQIRTIINDRLKPRKRMILFTPSESGPARLRFASSGISESEQLKLNDGSEVVELYCVAGERTSIELEFEAPYSGPIEITAFTATENT